MGLNGQMKALRLLAEAYISELDDGNLIELYGSDQNMARMVLLGEGADDLGHWMADFECFLDWLERKSNESVHAPEEEK